MHTGRCEHGCLAGESLIETVDGPVAIATLVGKSMPVLTRLPSGLVGFRLMTKVACTGQGVAVLRVSFDNGQSVLVSRAHVFYAPGLVECPVTSLAADQVLDTSFHFPAGYEFRHQDGRVEVSVGGVRVRAVEDGGTADVFGGTIKETHSYFTTAGVLCKE